MWVTNLHQAYDAYWNAHSRRDEQAAYHEILLFGGTNGYGTDRVVRPWIARTLRRLACWVEAER